MWFGLAGAGSRDHCHAWHGKRFGESGPIRPGRARRGEVRRLARRLLGEGTGLVHAPSPAALCHWQRQWVWGPGGYGAVLLVNCDRDDVTCYDQDNCDRHVNCLQGKGGRPGSWLSYPTGAALKAEPGARVPAPGHTLTLLKTCLRLAASPSQSPPTPASSHILGGWGGGSSRNGLTRLSLPPGEQGMLTFI